jgi:hypothetical protein
MSTSSLTTYLVLSDDIISNIVLSGPEGNEITTADVWSRVFSRAISMFFILSVFAFTSNLPLYLCTFLTPYSYSLMMAENFTASSQQVESIHRRRYSGQLSTSHRCHLLQENTSWWWWRWIPRIFFWSQCSIFSSASSSTINQTSESSDIWSVQRVTILQFREPVHHP